MEKPMQSARLYHCAHCYCQVLICSHCDRGNIYCKHCAKAARREAVLLAGQRYQKTFRGRINHAARAKRYRERQKQKVTHQGSPPKPLADLLRQETPVAVLLPLLFMMLGTHRCQFCRKPCSDWVRTMPIRRRGSGVSPSWNWRTHHDARPP